MIEWRWLPHLRGAYSYILDAKGSRSHKPHFFRSGSSRSRLLCKGRWAEIGSRYRAVTSLTVTPIPNPKLRSRSGDVIQSQSTLKWVSNNPIRMKRIWHQARNSSLPHAGSPTIQHCKVQVGSPHLNVALKQSRRMRLLTTLSYIALSPAVWSKAIQLHCIKDDVEYR